MKTRIMFHPLAVLCLVVASLASPPSVLAEGYDGVTVTFERPVEHVQQAAVDALTVVGAVVNKNETNLVQGKRKNKMGAFVGSGGEVLSVTLKALDANKTEAKIRTTKTFVGRAGQKVWDQAILDEMNKVLEVSTTPATADASTQPAAPEHQDSP